MNLIYYLQLKYSSWPIVSLLKNKPSVLIISVRNVDINIEDLLRTIDKAIAII